MHVFLYCNMFVTSEALGMGVSTNFRGGYAVVSQPAVEAVSSHLEVQCITQAP